MGGEYLSVKTGEIQNQFSSTWVWWMLSGQEHTQCCSIWQVFSVKKVCRCFCLWCESFIFIYTETFSIYSLIMCNLRFSNAFKSNLHGFFKLKTNMRSLVIATILAMDFFVDIFFQRILNFSNALASNVHDQNRDFFPRIFIPSIELLAIQQRKISGIISNWNGKYTYLQCVLFFFQANLSQCSSQQLVNVMINANRHLNKFCTICTRQTFSIYIQMEGGVEFYYDHWPHNLNICIW